ncbi:MAG: MBL fold metallo-hydrolase [Clostridia bacterium]|nr:MBL fold metallo-hydrolase [Clostridia bacterium]
MKITVVIEDTAPETLIKEWGLSLHIEYEGKSYLLDTGASSKFLQNAEKLNIDISRVDYAVLSHAHDDHSNGMDGFFEINQTAPFFIREGSAENCYRQEGAEMVYEGIIRGTLEKYKDRIVYAAGDYKISDKVYLIPHKTPGLEKIGEKSGMYLKFGEEMFPDPLDHEQSLVFDTEEGLVIFNSCSHGGADVIIREVSNTFKGKDVLAMIGGFHLFKTPDQDVRILASNLKETGVKKILTGHCTGENAYAILEEELGELVSYLGTGKVFNF